MASYESRMRVLRERRRDLAAERPKPVESLAEVQRELAGLEQAIEAQLALRHVAVTLGDALLWRRLNYDRGAISALGHGDRITWLSEGRGWGAEIAAVQQLWNDGVLALLTDLSTAINRGDIVCFFPDRIEVREVKAGEGAAADSPQMQRLEEAVVLINEGRANYDGHDRALVRAPVPYRTFLAQLPSLLAQARTSGRAVRRISDCQLVVAHDLSLPAAATEAPFDEHRARRAAGWKADDVVLNWGTTHRRMRDRRHTFPYLAPLSILPLAVEDVADILLGQLDYTTWINVSAVCRDLARRGYVTEPVRPGEGPDRAFLTAGLLDGTVLHQFVVAPHLREMMSLELMTSANLAAAIESMFKHWQEGGDEEEGESGVQRAVVMTDEARVWEALLN